MKVTESGKLKHRQLRIEDHLQRVSAEQKEDAEVCRPAKMTETDITNTNEQKEEWLEQVISRGSLNRAFKQVKKDKGIGGMDGLQVDELLLFLRQNQKVLIEFLEKGS